MSDDDLVASWEIISRAVARTRERVRDRIEVGGHSQAWFTVLHLLLHNGEHRLPMTYLARNLSITTGGFTKLADRMGQDGLIDRRNSSGDRRVVYATLTEQGLRVAQHSERQYRAALREHVLGVLTPARLAALVQDAIALIGPDTLDAPDNPELTHAAAKRNATADSPADRPERGARAR